MITTNYSIKICQTGGLNYTLAKGSKWYQKTLEFRERILYKMTELTVPIYKKYFKAVKTNWKITVQQLANYPEGSLGKAWYEFYQGQPFGISPNYERHDICHVLLGYRTSIVEETRMYSFLFGTGKLSAPTLFTIVIGCIGLPEFIPDFYRDYKLGRKAVDFSGWDFRYLLNEPIDTLRKMIFQKKGKGYPILF